MGVFAHPSFLCGVAHQQDGHPAVARVRRPVLVVAGRDPGGEDAGEVLVRAEFAMKLVGDKIKSRDVGPDHLPLALNQVIEAVEDFGFAAETVDFFVKHRAAGRKVQVADVQGKLCQPFSDFFKMSVHTKQGDHFFNCNGCKG